MREHPLLMKGPLVRATLAGLKTHTRRPIKPQPDDDIVDVEYDAIARLWLGNTQEDNDLGYTSSWAARCPMGRAGDRLWVRETWRLEDFVSLGNGKFSAAVAFQADENRSQIRLEGGEEVLNERFGWRPSIHMPRWACRLVLPLMSVRVERVQDITEEDAKAEGVEPVEGSYREGFRAVWQAIYGTWDLNPWVWVAEWKKIEVRK